MPNIGLLGLALQWGLCISWIGLVPMQSKRSETLHFILTTFKLFSHWNYKPLGGSFPKCMVCQFQWLGLVVKQTVHINFMLAYITDTGIWIWYREAWVGLGIYILYINKSCYCSLFGARHTPHKFQATFVRTNACPCQPLLIMHANTQSTAAN